MKEAFSLEDFPLAKVQVMNWLLLAVMIVSAAATFSWPVSQGILIGGLIANVSFIILKNDLMKIFLGPAQAVKVRFFIKYYLRLLALAALLYFLVRFWQVHTIGLLVGLSTVVVSILIIGLSQARKFFSLTKEAA